MQQLLKSWLIPDGYDGLKWFVNLTEARGPKAAEAVAARYRASTNSYAGELVKKYSPEFMAMYAAKESREAGFLNGDIKRFQDALMNLLSAITVLFSMQF
jgi:hypothetical protein